MLQQVKPAYHMPQQVLLSSAILHLALKGYCLIAPSWGLEAQVMLLRLLSLPDA